VDTDIDQQEMSPLVTVAGISSLFFCCTLVGTVVLGHVDLGTMDLGLWTLAP